MSTLQTSSAFIDLTSEPSESLVESEPIEVAESTEVLEPTKVTELSEGGFVPSGNYGEGYTQMLKRVIMKCEMEKHKNHQRIIPTAAYIDRATYLTGLHKDVLIQLVEGGTLPVNQSTIDRSVIHNELIQFYLEAEIIPTTTQLYNALHGKIPAHVDIDTFRKILIRMGYVWRKLGQTTLVIIEKPNITYEKLTYLKKIIHYREKKQPIYFVDENYFNNDGNYFTLQEGFTFQNQSLTVQNGVIYAVNGSSVHAKKYVKEFSAKQFQDWISNELIPILRPQSVIVFKKLIHHTQQIIFPPTLDSVKIEMIEWLQYHNVSHDKEMSKTELWSLIENYTNVNKNMYIIDNILKTRGHIALHLPNCINELTPTSLVYELIKQNLKLSDAIDIQTEHDIIIDSIKTELKTYDDIISSEEINIYQEEMKVDNVFDKLIDKMTSFNVSYDEDSDLPDCSDCD